MLTATSNTGNAYLRVAAYRMAVVGVQHNPSIRTHYARKRAAGISAMNSLGHCMSKALAIVGMDGAVARTLTDASKRCIVAAQHFQAHAGDIRAAAGGAAGNLTIWRTGDEHH
jgi:hypothetical protein